MTISEETMNIYQRAWHYLGLWSLPSQPRHPRYTVYSNLSNFTTLIVFNVCLVLSLFVTNSFDDKIETFMIASASVMTTFKTLLFITSRRDVKQLMYLMQLLESLSVINPRERSILLAAKRKSELATRFFLYSLIFMIAMIIIYKLMQTKRGLVWCSVYPFDWQSNAVWYVVAVIFQVICSYHVVMLLIFLDMWWASTIFMLAGFFDVLGSRMQRLGWSNMTNLKMPRLVSLEIKQNRLHEKELIDSVKYHLLCLRYFHVLEKCCNLHYFLQLTSSSGLIGITAYLLTTFRLMEDFPKFIWLSWTILSCCFQLAVPCYLGSILADKTDQLSFNLYESNWLDMSPKFKTMMRIFLELTKQPINMCTAWNLFIISLPTFVSVINSAYSMLSFLKGVQ